MIKNNEWITDINQSMIENNESIIGINQSMIENNELIIYINQYQCLRTMNQSLISIY